MYTVNSYDVCVPGFERLRSNREWIFAADLSSDMTLKDIYQALLDDVGATCPEGVNEDGARKAVDYWFNNVFSSLSAARREARLIQTNPFDIEDADEDCEPCRIILYVQCL